MLDLQVTIQGDKVFIKGLSALMIDAPKAIDRGLTKAARGVYREGFKLLSGAGSKKSNTAAGGYPVPVRTGDLRQLLDFVPPGKTKSNDAGSVTAAAHEAIVYDSAEYAKVIHDGKGSSEKYGPRPYITDGVEKFNESKGIKTTLEEEIAVSIQKAGLR